MPHHGSIAFFTVSSHHHLSLLFLLAFFFPHPLLQIFKISLLKSIHIWRINIHKLFNSFLKPCFDVVFLQLPNRPPNSLFVLHYLLQLSFAYFCYHYPMLQFPKDCSQSFKILCIVFINQPQIIICFISANIARHFPLLPLLKPCVYYNYFSPQNSSAFSPNISFANFVSPIYIPKLSLRPPICSLKSPVKESIHQNIANPTHMKFYHKIDLSRSLISLITWSSYAYITLPTSSSKTIIISNTLSLFLRTFTIFLRSSAFTKIPTPLVTSLFPGHYSLCLLLMTPTNRSS